MYRKRPVRGQFGNRAEHNRAVNEWKQEIKEYIDTAKKFLKDSPKKPCPLCGSDHIVVIAAKQHSYSPTKKFGLWCKNCHLRTGKDIDYEKVLELWNGERYD